MALTAMKTVAAGNAKPCSQYGPIVSVANHAANHVTPTMAVMAAAVCARWPSTARGEGVLPRRFRRMRMSHKISAQVMMTRATLREIGGTIASGS